MKKSSMKFSAAFSKFMFYFGNIVIGIIFVSPLIWMISASLKPESQIFANMNSLKTFFPVSASFNNYVEVFTRMNLPQVFKNTLLYIALILVLDLLVNSMCGYALAKFEFKGKGAIMNLVVALMVLPMEAIMLPLYIEMSQLGWVNTLAALVVPFVAKCFSIYMFRQFFCDVPDDLIEAAAIDGASPLKRFWAITFPLLSPTFFFLSVMNIIYSFFETFGVIHTVTQGGPGGSTNILVYKVYQDGFVGLNLGSSSAQSVVLMSLIVIITVLQFRYIEKKVQYTG